MEKDGNREVSLFLIVALVVLHLFFDSFDVMENLPE